MILLFRNKKKRKPSIENADQERIAKNIVVKCLRMQQHWAIFMQDRSERLSRRWKVIMLSFFCVCAGGFSFLLITRNLISNHTVSFRVIQVKTPLYIGKAGDEKTKVISIVTNGEYERIQRFRKYMDSLARSLSGKKRYDYILMDRPGLMDSIILIENIYQSQTKK